MTEDITTAREKENLSSTWQCQSRYVSAMYRNTVIFCIILVDGKWRGWCKHDSFRKQNPGGHDANAVYSFLRKRATQFWDFTTSTTVNAKCEVSIEEPVVSFGKLVIVGYNQSFQLGDVPRECEEDQNEEDESESEGDDDLQVKTTMEEWYRAKYFTESSQWHHKVAVLGEILLNSNTLKNSTISERFIFMQSGGDGRVTFL